MLRIFVDRGGTFTDMVIHTDSPEIYNRLCQQPERFLIVPLPQREWLISYKLLSENPQRYPDAVLQGIRDIFGLGVRDPLPSQEIEVVKMGTTVATNALLERKGDRLVLLITKGFGDALRIGNQNRPEIFARQIILPTLLYESVIEVEERYDIHGNELIPLNLTQVTQDLQQAYNTGIRGCAIVFLHSYRYPQHEQQVATIAQALGFTQISASHQVSPLMKLIPRGDTTVVDAYLSPILKRYVNQVACQLPHTRLLFMKSDGGLVEAANFAGKDSILSGPAGGIVGAVQTSLRAGFSKIVTFDMGGTSSDVAHFQGEYEREIDAEIAGVRMRVPVLSIYTVAAGGGSILNYDGSRLRVGPASAGANPGPACYRRGGPLTVTDANVMLGKIRPDYFPQIFGETGNLPLDGVIVRRKFAQLSQEIGNLSPAEVAAGFLTIAVDNMANALKKISLQRGYDVSEYALCTFGGAGGQVACLIADTLGIKTIFLHPYAGVLSAYGMGLADLRTSQERAIEKPLTQALISELQELVKSLTEVAQKSLQSSEVKVIPKVSLKYQGTDSTLSVNFQEDRGAMCQEFAQEYQQRYGFIQSEKALIVELVSVEVVQSMATPEEALITRKRPLEQAPKPVEIVEIFTQNTWQQAPIYHREDLEPGDRILGSAIIVEKISTIVVEPNWQAQLTEKNHLVLTSSLNN
jgi:5-oxoprolinase (ATP-hydrolysing)